MDLKVQNIEVVNVARENDSLKIRLQNGKPKEILTNSP